MNELVDKRALITGGARGFGRAIAGLFADEGADVAVADIAGDLPSERFRGMASGDDLAFTVSEVEARGRRAIGIPGGRDEGGRLRADGRGDAGGVRPDRHPLLERRRLLVRHGVGAHRGRLGHAHGGEPEGRWLASRAVAPHMIRRRYGKIVFTSSRDGMRAEPNYSHYCASKFGVIGYMKSLAIELGAYEINVNAVCPTRMTDRSAPAPRPAEAPAYWRMVTGTQAPTYEEFDEASGRENLFEAGGQRDFAEVAEGVLWLASDRSHMVTGHALPLDAGWIAKRGG